MSSTYSRYVADTTGNVEALFAKWQILVNNTDITNNTSSTISLEPVIEENVNVASNVVAPSSKGYFDIAIDPTNVDVSFNYSINLVVGNESVPDFKITGYSIVPVGYVEGTTLEITPIENNNITNTLAFDKSSESFQFSIFTIRVYFEWYEGASETMNDAADTQVGYDAATNNTAIMMNANISFGQSI
jgi:hypothetical protein